MERQKDSWYQTINNQPIPNEDFNCLIKPHRSQNKKHPKIPYSLSMCCVLDTVLSTLYT